MQKLPNAEQLFGAILVCEHLLMKSEDDPEARIRELEQPLAETARASEAGENPLPSKWAPPPGPPMPPPPPPPYGGSFSSPLPGTSSRSRAWWILAGVFVIGMIALPAGIMLFTAHQISRSGVSTLLPIPSISVESPSPSTAPTQTPAAGPSASPTSVTTVPASGNVSVAGINEKRTIVCNDGTVNVSGVANEVVITGHCASLTVSGVKNKVTVETADRIQASGFNNEISYLAGSPHIDTSGQGNAIQKR
jgi:hypothetical protein